MDALPVNWYQGLFVRPHHFQANDAYWRQLHHVSQTWDHPHGYGLRHINWERDALRRGLLSVTALEARTREGTLVRWPTPGTDPQERLACDLSSQTAACDIHLVIPKQGASDDNGDVRFGRWEVDWQDETRMSANARIECRVLRVALLASEPGQPPLGRESLPIARFKPSGSESVLEPSYIPPVLDIHAWPVLATDIVNKIRDRVREHLNELVEKLRNIEIGSRGAPADSIHMLMLDRLNESYTILDLLSGAPTHPFLAYTELCRLVGRLSLFSADRGPIPIEPYDHDDLGRIFVDVREKILLHLRPLADRYKEMPLEGSSEGFLETKQKLSDEWFDSKWKWYIGVEHGSLDRQTVASWLEGQDKWIMGSKANVQQLIGGKGIGLDRRFHTSTIPDLANRPDTWAFFDVAQEEAEYYYKEVKRGRELAMAIRGCSIAPGSRFVDVAMFSKQARLKFVLFAVLK